MNAITQPPSFAHDLTISLIVKNEAQTLKTCLEALTPLRKAISCQLILTDTGSTDGTQDIARAYADLYLEFDWCNDFSKARNHAIPHATGRWFFYLDADEICDHSLLQLVPFLADATSHNVGAASVTVRNYQGEEKQLSQYTDVSLARLVNFGRGKRYFKNIIHESIPVHRDTPALPILLHHEGYLAHKSKEKEGRNQELLLEIIEKDPHGLEHYIPMMRECTASPEKSHWLKQAFSVVEQSAQGKNHFSYPALLLELARFSLEEKNPSGVEEALEKVEEIPALHNTLPHLEVLGLTFSLYQEKSYPLERLLPLFSRYRTIYLALEENPDTQYALVSAYVYHTPLRYHHCELQMVDALKQSPLLEGGRALLTPSTGYQLKNPTGIYPLLPKTTYLSLELDLYPKIEEILHFLKEQGAMKDVRDVTRLLATHLKQKGQATYE